MTGSEGEDLMSMMLALTLLLATSANAQDASKFPMLATFPAQTDTGRVALQGKLELDECRAQAADLVPDEFDPSDPLLAWTPVHEQLAVCANMADRYQTLMYMGLGILADEQAAYPEGAWQRESIQNVADVVAQDWAYFLMEYIDLSDTETDVIAWSADRTLTTTRRNLRQHQR